MVANMHVVILYGGLSAEREVSLSSGKNVGKALENSGYKITYLDMQQDFTQRLLKIKPDVVFNCLHGTYGEDGCVAGMLNILKIPYTGSGISASSIAMDKHLCNKFLSNININFPEEIILHKNHIHNFTKKPPYVIKPMSQGSSVGIRIVLPEEEYDINQYEFNYGDSVIVQQYIEGTEINVAVLHGRAIGTLELKLNNSTFFDYQAKYTPNITEHIVPATLTKEQEYRLLKISELVYSKLGCRGLARLEFIYQPKLEEFFMLEINTHPGMTPVSICNDIAEYANISFTDMVVSLVKNAKYD